MAASHTHKHKPTADDLIFLLSLVGDHNSFIADQQQQSSSSSVHKSKKSSGDESISWQQTLSTLPKQRRDVILALKRLATVRQKWHNISAKDDIDDGIQLQQLQNEEASDVLEEVEDAASTIRTYCTEYIQSIEEFILALRKCWYRSSVSSCHQTRASNDQHNYSQLANIGYQLSTQLINQLQWDERLCSTILTFLNVELYQDITTTAAIQSSNDKLLVWSEAMLKMIKIDKSLWNFVEREVYDETLLELDDDQDPPEYLNGECSTQYISIDPSSKQLVEKSSSIQEENETEDEANLHERIVSSASLEEAVETFIQGNTCKRDNKCLTSFLLVGEEGSGKTHLLNTIQQQYSSSNNNDEVKILKPNYQVDLVGSSIGSTEDRLIALFTYATRYISFCTGRSRRSRKCIIMLDDIDQMFALSNDITTNDSSEDLSIGSTQYYIKRRCKALFITILDALKEQYNNNNGHLLLLCTSRSKCGEVVDRFDRTFHRGQPDEKERYQLITSCLSPRKYYSVDSSQDDNIDDLISLIVHHSAGRSAFELSQFCRETILRCAEASSTKESIFKHRLDCLDKLLQTKSPQSVRGGSLDGVVDMRVFTPEELQSKLTTDSNGDVHFPLLGAEAKRAHEALMNVVITPLCRSDEIRALLYGGGDGQQSAIVNAKPIRVGALLAGAPGIGKTALAYHCAALAAKMSRVSLLDVSCTSLIHKEIGGSERAVQQLFTAVRAAAPCIVLLDGIESVALKRGNDNTTEGTMDRVLSTFLTELDGIETGGDGSTSGNVAVIGITHNPDLIDPSLLRPGRLEKTITLGAPDFDARLELVTKQIEDVDFDFSSAGYFDAKTKDDISNFVAMSSAGMSAVEVIVICREASMVCLRELHFEATEKSLLRHDHFKEAIDIMKRKSSH